MKDPTKSLERNEEIVTFFYKIFSHWIHEGMNPDDARKEAYDAVHLRFGIQKGRLLNIISERRCSQQVNNEALRRNALALIGDLQIVNRGLESSMAKNAELIGLLKACLEDDSR